MSQLPQGRIHEIVAVEMTVGQVLALARLARAGARRAMRAVDPDFDPGGDRRDNNVEQARRYSALERLLLAAVYLPFLEWWLRALACRRCRDVPHGGATPGRRVPVGGLSPPGTPMKGQCSDDVRRPAHKSPDRAYGVA